jgi:hypothetical protein
VPVWAEGNAPRVRLKHAAAVTSLAFSPDGKTLATGDADSIVRLWDVAAASEVRHLQSAARPSTVLALAFRRDGKTLVAGNSNGTATLWRLATDKKYHDVDPKIYRCLSLATDGSLAVTGREDGTVGLWTPGGEDPIREIKFGDTIWHTAVLPDSNLVGIIHGKTTAMAPAPDRVLSIVDASTAKELRQFRVGGTGLKLCRAARMAATFSAASIYVWEMPTGKLRVAFRAATADAVFSPDGRFLAAADAEESAVCIYDLVEGKKAFLVAAASDDHTVFLWDLPALPRPAGKLSVNELEQHWQALLDDDGATGFSARNALLTAPGDAASFLRQRLPTTMGIEPKRLARLLEELNARQFEVRDQATKELERFGDVVEPALREALTKKPPLEVVRRIDQILVHNKQRPMSPEKLRVLRAVEVLEYTDTADARQALEQFAKLMPETLLRQEARTACQRLDRRAGAP